MILQTVHDVAQHLLALAPGDPTPVPNPGVPTINPGDPTAPRTINVGKLLGWGLVVLMFLVVFAGIKIVARTHDGKLSQGFQISLGALLGVAVVAIGITGVAVAVITNMLS